MHLSRLLLAAFFWLVTFPVWANQLSVSPTYFEFDNPVGQAISENVTVYNTSNEPMRVQLSVGDFWYDKEGKRSFPNAGSTPYSGAAWVSLPKREVEVPAHGQTAIPFVFSIPPQATPSGFATIFVEKAPEEKGVKKSNVNISLRIAVPILYRRPDAEPHQLEMLSFSLSRPTRFKPLLLKFVLNNEDDTHIFPEGNITIVKKTSKEFVAKDELRKEKVLLPKQKSNYEISLPVEPKSGSYEGLLTVFYGKEKTVVKKFSFSIP